MDAPLLLLAQKEGKSQLKERTHPHIFHTKAKDNFDQQKCMADTDHKANSPSLADNKD